VTFEQLSKEAYEHYRNQGGHIGEVGGQLAYLSLVHSEVSEAVECVRRGQREAFSGVGGKPEGLPSELADIMLRVMIFAAAKGIDLHEAMVTKHTYNQTRPSLAKEGKCL
jgi:NTP pyrophosphatase (non-canonical NTP hydrolase)